MQRLILLMCLLAFVAPTVQAQGVFKNLKKKVETIIKPSNSNTKEQPTTKTEQPQEKSTAAPAKKTTPSELLNQLPEALSVEALLAPDKTELRKTYTNQIATVEHKLKEMKSKAGATTEQTPISDTDFKSGITAAQQACDKYTTELTQGYTKLYNTTSPADRDVLTDKLTALRAQGNKETTEMWIAAVQKQIAALKTMASEAESDEAKGIQIVEAGIKALQQGTEFKPISAMPAQRTILYSGIEGLQHEEWGLGFAPVAGKNGCGSFLQSKFLAYQNGSLYMLSGGKKTGPFEDERKAATQISKTNNASFQVKPNAKWESTGGKRSVFIDSFDIVLNDGSRYYYPLAIHQCKDFVFWISLEGNNLVEYSYRL